MCVSRPVTGYNCPAYDEFGYYENPAVVRIFFPQKRNWHQILISDGDQPTEQAQYQVPYLISDSDQPIEQTQYQVLYLISDGDQLKKKVQYQWWSANWTDPVPGTPLCFWWWPAQGVK